MQKKSGFTLLELSMAVAVIGVLLSVMMVIENLRDNAKYKAFYKEMAGLREKVVNFKAIYGYLPGDFPKAGQVFKHILSTCTDETLHSDNATGCNGDGNNNWNTGLTAGCCYGEGYMSWLHLQLADLIGAPSGGDNYYKGYEYQTDPSSTNNNLYESKVYGGVLYLPLENWYNNLNHPSVRGPRYRIGPFTSGYDTANAGLFTPLELRNLDVKFDDGHPKTGELEGMNFFSSSNNFGGFRSSDGSVNHDDDCTTFEDDWNYGTDKSANLIAATYKVENPKKACMPQFIIKD